MPGQSPSGCPPEAADGDALERQPVTALRGVGPRLAERLERLGIVRVQDLLFHLPLRYEDRTRLLPLGALRPGMRCLVAGEVALADVHFGRRRALLVRLVDGTGGLTLRFFHFGAAQQRAFGRGSHCRCFGEVRRGPAGLEMVHPEYQLWQGEAAPPLERTLTPVYAATEGLSQASLRRLTDQALARLDQVDELLPARLPGRQGLPSLAAALRYVHRPPPDADLAELEQGRHPCQQRLVFEELLAHHLSLRRLRQRVRRHRAPEIRPGGALARGLLARLPFTPTAAQARVVAEILADLARPHPMLRLVQGDVGSGKTLVAALAAAAVVDAGWQVAFMAPTELLAEQHYRTLCDWFEPVGLHPVWLAARGRGSGRPALLADIAAGRHALVVGTHALFQADVRFGRLGLVVVDEQHRFGVHQRLALRDKGADGRLRPHQLTMTATPIPRTLAMAFYGDLDLSVIDELPPGRQPVTTVAVPAERRDQVIARVRQACGAGQQAYWICTLIEASEALQCQAAEETLARLRAELPELRLGLAHGRMKGAEREAVMQAFKAGDIDLLIATTVVEVGVDVPNASLMIIENPERLGLSQLHQLRGRVGRGRRASACVLLYQGPLSRRARERLAVMRETNDGFEIARRDLALRGPGEVLGTRQTGQVTLRVADYLRDEALLPAVERAAGVVEQTCPDVVPRLVRRWLGNAPRYGEV